MIGEWLAAAAATSAALLGMVILPTWLERRRKSYENISRFADEFYTVANKLASNKKTPPEVLQLLTIINSRFADPDLVRKIVWAALRGRLTEHAKRPSEKARAFLRAFNNMPEESRTHFATAIVCSLLASAERAGLFGTVFVRMMLFNPTAQKQSDAPTYASEIASSHSVSLVAA